VNDWNDQALLETCHKRSIEFIEAQPDGRGDSGRNPPGTVPRSADITAIFGGDAAVCALGMAVSGDKQLEQAAVTGLHTLAEHQAPNGQIAKFVDLHRQGATHASHGLAREGNPGPTMSGRMPAQG